MSRLVVLVPAHNEEKQLIDTIDSLRRQSRPAERIVVVSDNSTDDTFLIAKLFELSYNDGLVAYDTVDNPYRKSGALNQAWYLHAQDGDYIFTMDADTVLAEDFFEKAVKLMEENPDLGGACACPMLKDQPEDLTKWQAILWRMGKIDFGGYMRILCRWKFRPEVLFGYGTIFRQEALHDLAYENNGTPWDVHSIVEDYTASIQLRKMGWKLSIIPGALAYTDVPVSLKDLWVQRVRWAGGTWQELAREGFNKYTWRVWVSALGCVGTSVLRAMTVTAWFLLAVLGLPFAWNPIWLIPIIIGIWDRIDVTRYTVKSDWKDIILVGSFLPLELMGILREAWTNWSLLKVMRKRRLTW